MYFLALGSGIVSTSLEGSIPILGKAKPRDSQCETPWEPERNHSSTSLDTKDRIGDD